MLERENQIIESIIGKTYDEAKEIAGWSGYFISVSTEDGKVFVTTCDLNFTRINVDIIDNKIINAKIG